MYPKEYIGTLEGSKHKFAIVVSRFNELITDNLLKGCIQSLKMHGVNEENISIFRVPGAFELPVTIDKIASKKKFDSIIALGAVIRGSTAHFDYVAGESTKVGDLSLKYQIPIIFGVLTTDTIEQAIERAGTKAGNKGFEAAGTAIEMVQLFQTIDNAF